MTTDQQAMADKLTADILATLGLSETSPHGGRSLEWIEVHHLAGQAIHEAVIYGIKQLAAARDGATGETAVSPSS